MLKQLSAAALALALTLPTTTFAVSDAKFIAPTASEVIAESTDGDITDAQLEAAILAAKDAIAGDTDDYESFDYYANKGDDGLITFNLYWSDKDGVLPQQNITIDSNGYITNYSVYGNSKYYNTPRLPSLTKAQAVDAAFAFLKKAAPQYYSDLSQKHLTVSYNSSNGSYQVNGIRVRNNTQIADDSFGVTIESDGTVSYFYANPSTLVSDTTPRKSIGEAAILNAIKEKLPFELTYTSVYDSDLKKAKIVLSYAPTDTGSVINAADGGKYGIEYKYASGGGYYYVGRNESLVAEDTAAATAKSAYGLSDAEQNAVDDNAKYLKPADVTELIKANKALAFDDRLTVSYSRLYMTESHYTTAQKYYLAVTYNFQSDNEDINAYATVDAMTGEFKYYSYYEGDYYYEVKADTAKNYIGFDDAKVSVAKTLGSMFPFFGEFVRDTEEWSEDVKQSGYINYVRYVNDIRFDGDSIYAQIDRETGLITSLSVQYSADAEFPAPDGIISAGEAVDAYFNVIPLEKHYLPYMEIKDGNFVVSGTGNYNAEKQLALVYGVKNSSVRVDAFDGKLYYRWGVDEYEYDAPEYYESAAEKRLAGSANEEKLAALYNMNLIDVPAGFDENAAVTVEQFERILNGVNCYGYSFAGMEKTDTLTRAASVKIFVDALGYGKIAKISDIFVFDTETYGEVGNDMKGYYAIAQAIGLLEDFGMNLGGEQTLTISDAASIAYNYVVYCSADEPVQDDIIRPFPVDIAVETVARG